MSEYVYAGLTSQTIDVFLQDSSSSTGDGLASLVYNTSGLKCYYRKGATGSATEITLATQTVGGAWSSGGFVEIDSTNMKGVYRLDVPNAVVDTAGFVTLYVYGATNLLKTALRIDCRALPADVKKFGGTDGTFSSGRPEVNATHWGGTAVASVTINCNMTQISGDSGAADNAEAFFDGTGYAGTNNVIPTVSAVSGAVGSVTGNVGGNVVGSVGSVTAGVTVTTNNDKTGYSLTAGTGLGNQTADITGSLSGSVGSIVGLSAEVTKILDRLGYIMAQEIGACADAGTSAETYAITIDTTTYTIDHTGLDATGNRGTATLTKT